MVSSENYIIVNYHYVEDPSPAWKGFHPCPTAEFERHLRYLTTHFRMTSVSEVARAAAEHRKEKVCAITFDDGLRDQWTNAVPLLKTYGVGAAFFIITSTFDQKVPGTHKLHILLSRCEPDALADAWNDFIRSLPKEHAQRYWIPKDRRIEPGRRLHDDILTANLKEMVAAIPEELRNAFFEDHFKKQKLNEISLCRQFFMSEIEVRALADDGFTIGSHAHLHRTFHGLTEDTLENDIRESRQRLTAVLGAPPKIFSYPHGRFSEEAVAVLEREGFEYAVTIGARSVSAADSRFLLPRFDANDITRELNNQTA